MVDQKLRVSVVAQKRDSVQSFTLNERGPIK